MREWKLMKADTDGTGYLLTEDVSYSHPTCRAKTLMTDLQRANGLRIDKLSSDYLSVASATYLYAEDYEAPAIYKSGSTYFMFASHESGWCKFTGLAYCVKETDELTKKQTAPNDNIYCTATSLSGPWSAWADFATAGTNTFSSQTADIVSINGVVMYFLFPSIINE